MAQKHGIWASPPPHVGFHFKYLDDLKSIVSSPKKRQLDSDSHFLYDSSDDDDDDDNSTEHLTHYCMICGEVSDTNDDDHRSFLVFPHTSPQNEMKCILRAHVVCLAKFLLRENENMLLLPPPSPCPFCERTLIWSELIKRVLPISTPTSSTHHK